MSLHIGDVEFSTPVFLAPMAGVTDYVYRKICHEQGSGGSTTELISAKAVLYKNKNTGAIITTPSIISGGDWEIEEKKKKEPKKNADKDVPPKDGGADE